MPAAVAATALAGDGISDEMVRMENAVGVAGVVPVHVVDVACEAAVPAAAAADGCSTGKRSSCASVQTQHTCAWSNTRYSKVKRWAIAVRSARDSSRGDDGLEDVAAAEDSS